MVTSRHVSCTFHCWNYPMPDSRVIAIEETVRHVQGHAAVPVATINHLLTWRHSWKQVRMRPEV